MGLETSRGAAALLPERKQDCCLCWSRGGLGHSGPELPCSLVQDSLRWLRSALAFCSGGGSAQWRGTGCSQPPVQLPCLGGFTP